MIYKFRGKSLLMDYHATENDRQSICYNNAGLCYDPIWPFVL
jgi:hypothetical protein